MKAILLTVFAAAAVTWQGQTPAGPVKQLADDLVMPGYSAKQAWLKGLEADRPAKEEHQASWKLLSVVGPYVSVEESDSGYFTGAAHPYANTMYLAHHAGRKGKAVALTEIFPPGDIYKALLGDALVKQALAGKTPRDLDGLVKALSGYQSEDCVWGFSSDLLTRFAFHHVKGNQVAVRLGLSHGCEVARGQLTVLGIYLPIPARFAPALADAKTGKAGFLQERAPRAAASASVGG